MRAHAPALKTTILYIAKFWSISFFWARAGDLGWAPGLGPGLGLASSTICSTGRRARAINFDHRNLFSVVLFLCSKRSDGVFFVLFWCSKTPNVFVCLCFLFVRFLCSKRSGCCAFLVLETIRLCFCFVLFWAPKTKRVCMFVLFVCAFLVLAVVLFLCSKRSDCVFVLCFSCAPKTKRVCMLVRFFLFFSCSRNDPAVVLFLCSKRSDCVFCLCFSGAPRAKRVCVFMLFLCSMISKHLGSGFFLCWKRSDCVCVCFLVFFWHFFCSVCLRAGPISSLVSCSKLQACAGKRIRGSTPLRW